MSEAIGIGAPPCRKEDLRFLTGRGNYVADLKRANVAVHNDVTVVSYDDYRVGATWEVASCNPGTSAPEHCERALCDIVRRFQQHFDIAPT
jgi:hypothetical protein